MRCPVERRQLAPELAYNPATGGHDLIGYLPHVSPCGARAGRRGACASCLRGEAGEHDKPTAKGLRQVAALLAK